MIPASKIILSALVFGFIFLISACDDQPPPAANKSVPSVISGKISSQPIVQNKFEKDELNPKNNKTPVLENILQVSEQKNDKQEVEHYDSLGKIDPFESLIQEKVEESQPLIDERPKRILTPLEKIELSQIRLVAVIIMKNRQIAMVEEANGKGYEVGIGTYIGKNRGKVSEIKDSSIVIKELIKDYKGKLKERFQEIKLHKIDNED
jgi:type IV pilus assembly protein PilP